MPNFSLWIIIAAPQEDPRSGLSTGVIAMSQRVIMRYLVLIIALLGGCATPPKGNPFSELAETRAETTLVYVYRVGVPPYARSPEMLFNGIEKATVVNESFTYFYLEPGKYQIKTKWALDLIFLNQTGSYEFEAGKRYFVKLDGSMNSLGMAGDVIVTSTASRIVVMSEEHAIPEVRKTRYVEPLN